MTKQENWTGRKQIIKTETLMHAVERSREYHPSVLQHLMSEPDKWFKLACDEGQSFFKLDTDKDFYDSGWEFDDYDELKHYDSLAEYLSTHVIDQITFACPVTEDQLFEFEFGLLVERYKPNKELLSNVFKKYV